VLPAYDDHFDDEAIAFVYLPASISVYVNGAGERLTLSIGSTASLSGAVPAGALGRCPGRLDGPLAPVGEREAEGDAREPEQRHRRDRFAEEQRTEAPPPSPD